jgi:hypothetical protein
VIYSVGVREKVHLPRRQFRELPEWSAAGASVSGKGSGGDGVSPDLGREVTRPVRPTPSCPHVASSAQDASRDGRGNPQAVFAGARRAVSFGKDLRVITLLGEAKRALLGSTIFGNGRGGLRRASVNVG